MSVWVGARVVGGLAIVVGLLALVSISWYARGVSDATQLFQLLQGVILGTLGWLYGTQGFESARQAALRESVARRETARDSETAEEELERVSRDLELYVAIIRALRVHPEVREKVDEEMRRVGR